MSNYSSMPSEATNKKPKHNAIKFRLMPREEYEDGTLEDIETWIKRECARLIDDDWRAEEFKEDIAKADAERAAAGDLYRAAHSKQLKDCAKLTRELSAAKKKLQARYKLDMRDAKRDCLAAKKAHGQKVRALKTLKAKYNTYCNRFFNAVSRRIFQNMRSICGIQHSWSDPKVKRDIQSAEINKGALPKSLLETKLKKSPATNGQFSE